MKIMIPLDIYEERPYYMNKYLQHYGWHFSPSALEEALKWLKRANPSIIGKQETDSLLEKYGIQLERARGLDYVYVAAWARAYLYGTVITDEEKLAQMVKSIIDDSTAADGEVFRVWYAIMTARGIPIDWEYML